MVDESDGVVNILEEKNGVFSQPFQGTVTTVATGSASGQKLCYIVLAINMLLTYSFCMYSIVSSDYTGGEYPFTIQPAEQQTTISIPITDDITVEQLQKQFSESVHPASAWSDTWKLRGICHYRR